jgi:2-keto-4-pentenoate hydratase/2-oxohepta-3-ene-1,7-dioic acid hydratase in catechol pathway
MKLFRFGPEGQEKPGVILQDGKKIDVSAFGSDYNEAFFGGDGLMKLQEWVNANGAGCPEVTADVRVASAVTRPSKIVCIGLNYAKHAEETNAAIPKEPIIFFKATSAFCGPNDNVIIPPSSKKTDWEVELAIVIGKKATYIKEADAESHIAGYVLHNDYSEREWQIERGGQWVKGKSADTFAPLGPWMATRDELKDPQDLRLWLSVNGEMLQDSSTNDMIFKIPFLVYYVSQFMTLLPGDIISTGTPFGVGLGFNPQRYLKAGDVIELGIDGLGTQKQTAIDYK